MRILVNCTNLRVGGAIQKAVQFVLGCIQWGQKHQWMILLSPEVAGNLQGVKFPSWMRSKVSPGSPAKLFGGRAARRFLRDEENEFLPDVVFSVFGPNYFRFQSPHLMGFAIPWITNPSRLAWDTIDSKLRKILFRLRLRYYRHWAQFADGYLFETQSSMLGMKASMGINSKFMSVVPNCCSDYYFAARKNKVKPHPCLPAKRKAEVFLLAFSSYKPHKNFHFIPRVAASLKSLDPDFCFRFVFSLDPETKAWMDLVSSARKMGVGDSILTVGVVPVCEGPSLYEGCDALFMPTIMEVFSATYPEAMAMQRPIITSDLPFAREVCRKGAVYFDPTKENDAANCIISVFQDSSFRQRIIGFGEERLNEFGGSEDRFVDTVSNILKLKNSLDQNL